MSLISMTETHTVTLVALTESGGGGGALIQAETEYAGCKCYIATVSARDAADFAKIGSTVDYQLYFHYNPKTKTAGNDIRRVKFTDENGVERVFICEAQPERHTGMTETYWRIDCREQTGVENR